MICLYQAQSRSRLVLRQRKRATVPIRSHDGLSTERTALSSRIQATAAITTDSSRANSASTHVLLVRNYRNAKYTITLDLKPTKEPPRRQEIRTVVTPCRGNVPKVTYCGTAAGSACPTGTFCQNGGDQTSTVCCPALCEFVSSLLNDVRDE